MATKVETSYGRDKSWHMEPDDDWERQHFQLIFPGGIPRLGGMGCQECAEEIFDILERCCAESQSAEPAQEPVR